MDDFSDASQPRCPECGSVLHDVPGGFHCRSCNLAYLPHVDAPA